MKANGIGIRFLFKFGLTIAVLMLFMAGGFFLLSNYSIGQEDMEIRTAPVNPEFQKYLLDRDAGLVRTFTEDGYPLGEAPSPLNAKMVKPLGLNKIDYLPSSYSLINLDRMTSVKNQGNCGSCWSFAAYGSLESNEYGADRSIPIDFAGEPDWSEQHMIENHGFDYGKCEGGNQYMSAAYLTRWDGPRLEKKFKYDYGTMGKKDTQKHIQKIVMVPPKTAAKKNKLIKNAIMKFGAGYVSMYWSNSCYNSSTNAYYNKSLEVGGHGVCVVGWDDNFSRNKFLKKPPGDGAYIVKNSWGKNWGDNGYFYVSYYDNYFCKRSYVTFFTDESGTDAVKDYDNESVTNYKSIYQYDPYGWVDNIGYSGRKIIWMSNMFQAKKNETLKAVSFYSVDSVFTYTLYIYTKVNNTDPTKGTLAYKKSGKIKSPGYFTLPINNIPIKKGQKFAVVIKAKTKTHTWPAAVEYYYNGYCSDADANAGESWISSNGKKWSDLTKVYKSSANFCIKAFAK
jgi:C1A family cysteine protease